MSCVRQLKKNAKMYNIEMKNTKFTYTFLFHSVYYLYNYWFSRVLFSLYISTLWQHRHKCYDQHTKRKAKARVSNTHEHHFFVSHCFVDDVHIFFYQFIVGFVFSLLKCADKQSLIWNCYKLIDHLKCLCCLFKFQLELGFNEIWSFTHLFNYRIV